MFTFLMVCLCFQQFAFFYGEALRENLWVPSNRENLQHSRSCSMNFSTLFTNIIVAINSLYTLTGEQNHSLLKAMDYYNARTFAAAVKAN